MDNLTKAHIIQARHVALCQRKAPRLFRSSGLGFASGGATSTPPPYWLENNVVWNVSGSPYPVGYTSVAAFQAFFAPDGFTPGTPQLYSPPFGPSDLPVMLCPGSWGFPLAYICCIPPVATYLSISLSSTFKWLAAPISGDTDIIPVTNPGVAAPTLVNKATVNSATGIQQIKLILAVVPDVTKPNQATFCVTPLL